MIKTKTTTILISTICILIGIFGCKENDSSKNINVVSGEESLSDPSIKPKILLTYPANGTIGPYNIFNGVELSDNYTPHFTVQFNKLIDIKSLNNNIRCLGFSENILIRPVHSFQDKLFDNVIDFEIRFSKSNGYRSVFELNKTYTIIIDSLVNDINGNLLGKSYSFSFIPEPYFRVTTVLPAQSTIDIEIYYRMINIFFNQPIDTSIILKFISISPNPNGRWFFLSNDGREETSKRLIFEAPLLKNGTTYTVSVSDSAKDLVGNPLGKKFISSFTTIPFGVSYTYPVSGTTNVSPTSWVYFYMTGPVDTGTVRTSFNISPSVTGSFAFENYSNGSWSIILKPTTPLVNNTKYTVSLAGSVKSIDGTQMNNSKSFYFITKQ